MGGNKCFNDWKSGKEAHNYYGLQICMRSFHPNNVSPTYKDITAAEPEASPVLSGSQIAGFATISDACFHILQKNSVSAPLDGAVAGGLLQSCRW